jgi:2-phosphosulfolactate phosphatase
MQIEVAILPHTVTRLHARVVLVVDVIRATTSIVTLFERGARTLTLASDVEDARRRGVRQPDALLLGEHGGLPPQGFAYGNSPTELAHAAVARRDLVFTTSNGTRAIHAVVGARAVLAACMRNARAAAQHAWDEAQALDADLAVVCAGRARCTLVGQDDLICAGYLVECLVALNGGRVAPWQPDADFDTLAAPPLDGGLDLDESAVLARQLYHAVVRRPHAPQPEEIARAFAATAVGQGLARLGHEHDTVFCAQPDRSACVPRLERHPPSDDLRMTWQEGAAL